MHFVKAAFVTAGFFVGFVVGKDLAIMITAQIGVTAPAATRAAA